MYMYTLVWNCLSFWKLSMGEHRAIFHSSRLLKVCWKEIPNHCSFQQIHTQYCGQCPWQLVGELLFSMHESPLIVHRHHWPVVKYVHHHQHARLEVFTKHAGSTKSSPFQKCLVFSSIGNIPIDSITHTCKNNEHIVMFVVHFIHKAFISTDLYIIHDRPFTGVRWYPTPYMHTSCTTHKSNKRLYSRR